MNKIDKLKLQIQGIEKNLLFCCNIDTIIKYEKKKAKLEKQLIKLQEVQNGN